MDRKAHISKDELITRALLLLVGIVMSLTTLLVFLWSWPRDVIDINIIPVQKVFDTRKLEFTSVVSPYGYAESLYERSIECGTQRFLVNSIVTASTKGPTREVSFNIEAPDLVPLGVDCVLLIESTHKVTVAPFLTKTITDNFKSTTFQIKGE